jgi:hypothetical protein
LLGEESSTCSDFHSLIMPWGLMLELLCNAKTISSSFWQKKGKSVQVDLKESWPTFLPGGIFI